MTRFMAIILLLSFTTTSFAATLGTNCTISNKTLTCTIKESADNLSSKEPKLYILPPEKFSKMLSDIDNLTNLVKVNEKEIELLEQKIDLQKQMIEQYKDLLKTYEDYAKKVLSLSSETKILLYLVLGIAITIGAGVAIHYATK